MAGGSSKREGNDPRAAGDPDAREVAGAGVSGVRIEIPTIPARSDACQASQGGGAWSTLPSRRPTRVPEFDVTALALESSLRHDALPRLPADVAIPTRTRAAAPVDLEHRAAFLLCHVDGQSSVGDIAQLTDLSVEEVLVAFLGLASAGLIELGSARLAAGVPSTGKRPTRG